MSELIAIVFRRAQAQGALISSFALCLALALSACGVVSKGELTEAQCRDKGKDGLGIDDDLDDYANCADPDCWVYDFCAEEKKKAGMRTGDSGASTQSDAAAAPAAGEDASTDLDAGHVPVPERDAALPSTQCGVPRGISCADDENCTLGACVKPGPAGRTYVLQISHANVPSQNALFICYDSESALGVACSFTPVYLCGICAPDTFVETRLNGKVVNTTSTINDDLSPEWSAPGFALELEPTDELKFTIIDKDAAPDTDTVIFSCTKTGKDFMTVGAIGCPADARSPIPAGGAFSITIETAPGPELM